MQPNSGMERATARWIWLAAGALLAGIAVTIGGRIRDDLADASARVASGDAIVQVGNSGNSSEPHLHINTQEPGTADAPFSGAPIPIRINGRYLARNDRFLRAKRTGPSKTFGPRWTSDEVLSAPAYRIPG